MLKVLFWFLFDAFFIYSFFALREELGWYVLLFIAFIAFFTWELVSAIKHWLK